MDEVLTWLRPQPNSLTTYKTFQQKTLALAHADPQRSAAFLLLAALAGRFIERYDGQPLTLGVVDEAFKRLIDLVEKAARSLDGPPGDQICMLNEIARSDLG